MNNNKPKYRLKKDWIIPGGSLYSILPAGTEFYRPDEFHYYYKCDFGFTFDIKQIELTEWFEKIEEPKEWEIVSYLYEPKNPEENIQFRSILTVRRLQDGCVRTKLVTNLKANHNPIGCLSGSLVLNHRGV